MSSALRRLSGLSPRVRGNLVGSDARLRRARSIPACAGEPSARRNCTSSSPVYPRVCGGTCMFAYSNLCARGLSPRVRGNLHRCISLLTTRGLVVTCAGDFIMGRKGKQGKSGLSKNYASWKVPGRRDRITPSWSTNSTGGSPMTRTVWPLGARGSCQVMTMQRPPSSWNHSAMTAHTRSRTGADSLGDV